MLHFFLCRYTCAWCVPVVSVCTFSFHSRSPISYGVTSFACDLVRVATHFTPSSSIPSFRGTTGGVLLYGKAFSNFPGEGEIMNTNNFVKFCAQSLCLNHGNERNMLKLMHRVFQSTVYYHNSMGKVKEINFTVHNLFSEYNDIEENMYNHLSHSRLLGDLDSDRDTEARAMILAPRTFILAR